MLNPSTADARQDDPTIRRCIGFASANGYGRIVVTNLFAWRATNPDDLWKQSYADIVGPENDRYTVSSLKGCQQVIAGWGGEKHQWIDLRAKVVYGLWPELFCLGVTAKGRPRHPLFVKGAQPIVPWES